MADQLTPVLAYRCLVKEDDREAPSFLFESVVNGTQQVRARSSNRQLLQAAVGAGRRRRPVRGRGQRHTAAVTLQCMGAAGRRPGSRVRPALQRSRPPLPKPPSHRTLVRRPPLLLGLSPPAQLPRGCTPLGLSPAGTVQLRGCHAGARNRGAGAAGAHFEPPPRHEGEQGGGGPDAGECDTGAGEQLRTCWHAVCAQQRARR